MDRFLVKISQLSAQNKLQLAILGALVILIGLVNSAINEHRQDRLRDAQQQYYQQRLETESNSKTMNDSVDMFDQLMELD